jgi:propanol-preferring alcohol dehydrogenase
MPEIQAMILSQPGNLLKMQKVILPELKTSQVLIKVTVCGVCRTDLNVVDGELDSPKLPLILGHEIVGNIIEIGSAVNTLKAGDFVGVPWLGYTCGKCYYCQNGQENLCNDAKFTGYTLDGGYAQYVIAEENYCFRLPNKYDPVSLAPMLCAGLIGWRSYKLAGDFKRLGIYGFGVAAHILTQIACSQNKEVYAFTKDGDSQGQDFAKKMGAVWAGGSGEKPPVELDAALVFASVGDLVLASLKSVRKGGSIVCGGIYMTDIPPIPYKYLWGERIIRSVANLTRADALEFIDIAGKVDLHISTYTYPLVKANEAIADFRSGKTKGAAVLVI